MPLSLEQYADYLDTRQDLSWPAAPEIRPPKAKSHLVRLPDVRAVTWSVYGTLLAIAEGEFLFEHPQKFVREIALEKTIQEFKMWQAMSRKPGKPSVYMGMIYEQILHEMRLRPSNAERYPEIGAEKIWEMIVKRLLQNDYRIDVGSYGSLDEFSRKVAYFYHASLQGTGCYPDALRALEHVQRTLGLQGILSDGQCFTPVQLARGLRAQGIKQPLSALVPESLTVLSHEVGARKPSERLYCEMLSRLENRGLKPQEVLHVGSSLTKDIGPARALRMRTALFAGDKASLEAPSDKLKRPDLRPDVLLTTLDQIAEVVG